MVQTPPITTIEWVNASTVLGHGEHGFSAWLADNLELVANALDLPNLSFVAREFRIQEFRADILALADDGTDEGLPVIIENQYGRTDHDHLGKVVTYLAGQQRGLGIWIAEEFRDAHLAAVEFLNRTSDESVGYALVRVRFAPSPSGHYVDLQVAAKPNRWLKDTFAAVEAAHKTVAPQRVAVLSAIDELAGEQLRDQGWIVRLDGAAKYVELKFPAGHPLADAGYLGFRASPTRLRFYHVVDGTDSLEASVAAVALLRERYDEELTSRLPTGTSIDWNPDLRSNAVNQYWTASHPDGGWKTVTPKDAANWAKEVAGAWMDSTIADPIDALVAQANETGTQESDDSPVAAPTF